MSSVTALTSTAARPAPEATMFTNSTSKIVVYYFNNNPWKPINPIQKLFRFCIICGEDRFSDETWAQVVGKTMGLSLSICKKESCNEAFEFVPDFVPEHHYLVRTELDKSRAKAQNGNEYFEVFGEINSFI